MHVMKIDYASSAAIFVTGLVVVAGASIAASAQEPEDPAALAFARVCSSCHPPDRILATRRTRTQWEEVVQKMIDRGAQGTDEDFTAAQVHLLRVSGRVNVNRALSQDFVDVLGLTEQDAAAIGEYRKAYGDFQDFDGLCKVPGIDIEKLKQGRDAISY